MSTGTSSFKFSFGEFLEGGGAVYLEPFWEGTIPQGKYPHGILINAKGESPAVITAEWTNADNIKISNPLKFGSSVYLNIYTDALYGNNIKVQLKDKNQVIRLITLGITDSDDKLFATEYLNNETEERTKEDISKQKEFLKDLFPYIRKNQFLQLLKEDILSKKTAINTTVMPKENLMCKSQNLLYL